MTAWVQLDFADYLFDSTTPVCVHKRASKTIRHFSEELLKRYTGLSDISPDEWDEYFPNTGKPWSSEDVQYLVEWWGKDDVLSLSYALGRPPWNLQRVICRLRAHGIVAIPYLREQHRNEDEGRMSDDKRNKTVLSLQKSVAR